MSSAWPDWLPVSYLYSVNGINQSVLFRPKRNLVSRRDGEMQLYCECVLPRFQFNFSVKHLSDGLCDWQMGVGRTLRERTLGLYGYGRIAQAVAEYARAIGMKIQWWASDEGRARAKADGQTVAASRAQFFATSDVVSLHVRLKPATRGIITAQDLADMAPRSLLVNTSRSGLIATGVLEAEIAKKRIHAAVDVYDAEPLRDTSNILLTHPNVLPTPHIGFVTEDEFDLQFSDIFDQINAYDSGAPIHMINPEVWS